MHPTIQKDCDQPGRLARIRASLSKAVLRDPAVVLLERDATAFPLRPEARDPSVTLLNR